MFFLREGIARATGCDDEWATYFECDECEATHEINVVERGMFVFCPPSWELRAEYHDRVEPVSSHATK